MNLVCFKCIVTFNIMFIIIIINIHQIFLIIEIFLLKRSYHMHLKDSYFQANMFSHKLLGKTSGIKNSNASETQWAIPMQRVDDGKMLGMEKRWKMEKPKNLYV